MGLPASFVYLMYPPGFRALPSMKRIMLPLGCRVPGFWNTTRSVSWLWKEKLGDRGLSVSQVDFTTRGGFSLHPARRGVAHPEHPSVPHRTS